VARRGVARAGGGDAAVVLLLLLLSPRHVIDVTSRAQRARARGAQRNERSKRIHLDGRRPVRTSAPVCVLCRSLRGLRCARASMGVINVSRKHTCQVDTTRRT
jgi:hypothetical protein